MKKCLAIFLLMISAFTDCSYSSSNGDDKIEYHIETDNFTTDTIRFERAGGGQKDFTINDTAGFYRIWVTSWRFRDTSFAIRILKAHADSMTQHVIEGLLHGTTSISGTIFTNDAPTGDT